jgi:hypothetical protein
MNTSSSTVKVGDKLVVYGHQAKVESINYDPKTDRTTLNLDYGSHGKAKVYLHDENKIWFQLKNAN